MTKKLDLICIGRVAVDLYAQQIGSRLEDVASFAKYLGGSSGNVAYGTARLGLNSAMLARVGDEQFGQFLREELQRAGANTDYLITDKNRLTALAILGIKDQDTFPLLFYRENCADMGLTPDDIDENFIASARAVAVTGTHLSNPQTRAAVLTALHYARKHGLKTALDIDYRPVLWGLTSLGDGETRFIASEQVTQQLQEVLTLFDVIVGTEEEFHIAGGSTDTLTALKNVRQYSQAALVCKRGALGCSVFEGAIPDDLDAGLNCYGVRVEVLNVLGAGDAFMSGLMRGWLHGEGWEQACRYANACGAIVVSRHGCAPAMPTKIELDDFIQRQNEVPRPDLDKRLQHLHRVTTRRQSWSQLAVFAFDHRKQLIEMAQNANADIARIPKLKELLFDAYQKAVSESAQHTLQYGLLADSTFAQQVLNKATGQPIWIGRPIEQPGSRPLLLEHGDIGSQLVSWPLEHVVKCLAFYHPQDQVTLRLMQEQKLEEVYHACCQSGHELLLEVILPHQQEQTEQDYYHAIERFYNLGIYPDWWKLPPLSAAQWQKISALIEQRDPHCRGILVLGLDAPLAQLKQGLLTAKQQPLVKGFAVGRTIFAQPAQTWLMNQMSDAELVEHVKHNYLSLISCWLANPVGC